MKKLLILIAILALFACAPKYVNDNGMIDMTGYAVTEITYDANGKIKSKKTMVPVKSEWAKMVDGLVKEFADLVGLTDPIIPGVLK